MDILVEVEAEERVGVKCRLCDLQKPSRVEGRKVPETVVEAMDLAVKLADDTVVTSPGAVDVAEPRVDELTRQLAITRPEVVLLTSKLYDFEEERKKTLLEHEMLLKKLCTEVKTSVERTDAEHNGALSCYRGVLRSI